MNETVQTVLDGNAAAGDLRAIFTVDVTMATCRCNHCAKIAPFAEGRVYAMEPGLIVRCANCEGVLMRVVTGAGNAWLDLRGMSYLQFPLQSAP